MYLRQINVSGTGCICAAGNTVNECMDSMYSGKRNYKYPEKILVNLKKKYPVFEVPGLEQIDDNITPTSYFLKTAVNEAMLRAGLSEEFVRGKKIGVCIGTTVGCTLNNESFYREYKKKKNSDIKAINKYFNNNPAKFISSSLGLKGPVATIANACSSGTDAVGLARYWIQSGLCDIVFAGGTDELSRITYLGFSSMLITSEEPCKPFDKTRNGLNLGEGAGVLVLEREDSAAARGVKPLAKVIGYSCASDAYHPTAPHPDGEGLKRAIKNAFLMTNFKEFDAGFINAHGTSTPNNDKTEGKVINEIYPDCPVVSTKAYTGHTLGAAGGIEAVFTIQALLEQKLPATAGYLEFDEDCRIFPTIENIRLNTEIGVSHSLAFGGNNGVLVFGREV